MAELKLQTLQHFSTFCGGTVENIKQKLSNNYGGGYGVSYTSLRNKHIPDNLTIHTSISQIRKCIERKSGERDRKANHSVLDAYEIYLRGKDQLKAVPIEHRYYSLGRNFLVPVNPVCVLVDAELPKVFWPSFWKTPGRLDGVPGAIFGSILRRTYFNKHEYYGVGLEFLDLSAINGSGARSARVYDLNHFPDLSDTELTRETDKFLQAYFETKVTAKKSDTKQDSVGKSKVNPDQHELDL